MNKTLSLPSNRSFGWTFTGIFVIAGAYASCWARGEGLCGRDTMARRFEPGLKTDRLKRDPPGPADDSYRNMF